jgi:predicted nucleic acid-binding protein
MVHLDTSVLVDALTGPRRSAPGLRLLFERGERVSVCTLVLYEWLRGPRKAEELRVQEALIPAADAMPFDAREAATAAGLYRRVRRPRGREIDLAIAACAIADGASLWTLNAGDFTDIPGLILVDPAA